MNKLLALVAAVSASAILAGCGQFPVHETHSQAVSASARDIHRAILHVAKVRRYDVDRDAPGAVTLSYPPRDVARSASYQATYRVTYSNGSYQVHYVKSRGLDAKPCTSEKGTVCGSRKLQQWQQALETDIGRELIRARR